MRRHPGERALVCGVLAAAAALLGACGSSGSGQATGATKSACEQVSAVLSDGPDPGADPIGYAEAQILPLRQIKTADKSLERAIDDLASAYQQFFRTKGWIVAKQAVIRAAAEVNTVGPGAAS
jgi:hypothetical protein